MKNIILIVVFILSSPLFSWNLDGVNYKFEKLTKNVYMMHGPTTHPNVANKGFMNNVGLIVSKKSLIVLDPGSTKYVGEMVLKEIEKISKKPIVAVFDSHVHGDHWLANNAIKNKYPNVKIYGSKNMITKIKNGEGKKWIKTMHTLTKGLSDGTKVVAPNINVKDMQKIKIDNETFLIHIPIKLSHTSTDILVEHINTKTLFLGDNALVDRLGRFEADSSIYGNIEVLKYALKLKVAYSVPGHGMSGKKNSAIYPFLFYLQDLEKVTKKGYKEDKEDYEIKPMALKVMKKYKNWASFDSSIGSHIIKMYSEIEDKDE